MDVLNPVQIILQSVTHDPRENEGAAVDGLEHKEVGSIFTLRLKGSKNKELYSNLLPPDSLANKHTYANTNDDDSIGSESLPENRNRNKAHRIIHI